MYFITEKGYETMIDAFIENIARAEMIVENIVYDADIIRVTKIDFKTLKILIRGEHGSGKVNTIIVYNKEGEQLINLPREMNKPKEQYVYTTCLFDLFPEIHPVGSSLAGIGKVK